MLKKILIVEDEPDIKKMVMFRLKNSGYDVVHANNGQEALNVLKTNPKFDLILVDLVMPVMDGHELCRMLHQNNVYTDIPVIILSASMTKDLSSRAKELHVKDYVAKPFDVDVLLTKIKKLIG